MRWQPENLLQNVFQLSVLRFQLHRAYRHNYTYSFA